MENHKEEITRKSIHFSSLLIPLSYRYLMPLIFQSSISTAPSRSHHRISVLILFLLTAVSLFVEFLRNENKSFRNFFNHYLCRIMRSHEKSGITGATYLLFSSLICISFFPFDIAFVSLCFLAIGDTMAALVGKTMGKRKLSGSVKSLEGSLACFVSTFVFALFFLNPILALTGSLTATLAELSAIGVDDNLKIPLISGLVMSFASIFI